MTLDNLTQLQKIAIEGEVASALTTAKHNPEILYRIYTMLKKAPKDIGEYIIEISKELLSIEEKLFNKVMLEVSSDSIPVWLWIDRTVADIKLSLTLAEADGMICEAEIDKKLSQKKVIKSAFVTFCRSAAILYPAAARELCYHILNEESLALDFLSDACFALIEEINELPEKDKIPEELMSMSFDIRNTLSYRIETRALEQFNKAKKVEKTQSNKDVNKTVDTKKQLEFQKVISDEEVTVYAASLPEVKDGGFLAESVTNAITKILNEQLKTRNAMKAEAREAQYAVVKEYKGSDISSTLKTCKTEQEAEEFKGKLEEQFPELLKSCTIKIKRME